MLSMFRAIIFDLDNTLIDFFGMKRKCCKAAIEAMIDSGLRIDEAKALRLLFRLYDRYGIEYGRIFQAFLRAVKRRIDYRILAEGINAYRKAQLGMLKTYPWVKKTLIRLRELGLKLGILSDAPRLKAWLRLVELGIADFFDVVVAYGDVKAKKTSTKPFERALKLLRSRPGETLMVGDSKRDMNSARKLGIATCWARYGHIGKGVLKADYTINSFAEILNIVKD